MNTQGFIYTFQGYLKSTEGYTGKSWEGRIEKTISIEDFTKKKKSCVFHFKEVFQLRAKVRTDMWPSSREHFPIMHKALGPVPSTTKPKWKYNANFRVFPVQIGLLGIRSTSLKGWGAFTLCSMYLFPTKFVSYKISQIQCLVLFFSSVKITVGGGGGRLSSFWKLLRRMCYTWPFLEAIGSWLFHCHISC